jgi:class 3 adenylate cyclase
MSQTRRLAAILAADVAGYSRLMGADEEGTLERLKALRRELLDPKIAEHHGRIVKTTGDGLLVEFASVVDAMRCAVDVQQAMPERNAGVAADNRIELRIGINLGDVIVEGDDLYGDGVNIAARIEALAEAGGVFVSNTVHDQVRGPAALCLRRSGRAAGQEHRPTGPRLPGPRRRRRQEAIGCGSAAPPRQAVDRGAAVPEYERRSGAGIFRRRHGRGNHYCAKPHPLAVRHRPQFELHVQRPGHRREAGRA